MGELDVVLAAGRQIGGRAAGRGVLLLQGPMGPFFRKLDDCLQASRVRTCRICFSGGDRFFANRKNRIDYRGKPDSWKAFVSKLCAEKKIGTLVLYGDCRFYHRVAIGAARASGIQVFVFEEGYLRPNFVTLETEGVNARSRQPRDAAFYRGLKVQPTLESSTPAAKYNYQRQALFAILYFLGMHLEKCRYPHYRHHRSTHIGRELIYGLRNAARKIWFRLTEKPFIKAITEDISKRYFLVPLQVQYDFQISRHSHFKNMQDFIATVMTSFARCAPDGVDLVFKHHPMDRGRRLYYKYIRDAAKRLGVTHRVQAVHDAHLPTCLKNAIGTVTINSTVGIQSLYHGASTIVLGKALYDIEGLTCHGMPLDRFWSEHHPPDKHLFQKFRRHLIEQTQLTGSFYGGFAGQ